MTSLSFPVANLENWKNIKGKVKFYSTVPIHSAFISRGTL
jgi:hypothetical protein